MTSFFETERKWAYLFVLWTACEFYSSMPKKNACLDRVKIPFNVALPDETCSDLTTSTVTSSNYLLVCAQLEKRIEGTRRCGGKDTTPCHNTDCTNVYCQLRVTETTNFIFWGYIDGDLQSKSLLSCFPQMLYFVQRADELPNNSFCSFIY